MDQQNPKTTTDQETKDDGDTIFMRNLSYDSNEEGLKAFVEENFGKTKYCLICRNKETGDSKGTAFAKFENAEDATKCLQEFKDFEMQHKFHFDGRNIIVLPSIPRDKVHEVKQNREKEILKGERHKRRERLIKERVLAKQQQRRPIPSSKAPFNKNKTSKGKNNIKENDQGTDRIKLKDKIKKKIKNNIKNQNKNKNKVKNKNKNGGKGKSKTKNKVKK